MHQETDQQIFLVSFQHHVRHGGGGRGDAHLEEEESAVKVLESRVDASTVVIVEQEIDGVKLSILFTNKVDVCVYKTRDFEYENSS